MTYYLMFHIDRVGERGIILKKSNNLLEMDNYIGSNFLNRKEVFNAYREEIQELCLDYMDEIREENIRNNHNRTGAISLFCKYQNNYGTFIYKIPIIYKNDNKLPSNLDCLKKIKDELENDKVLETILKEKSFLLSKYEIGLIYTYFKFKNFKCKNDFINTFINRIKKFTLEKQYFFFRCLVRVCNLNKLTIETKKGMVGNINLNMPTDTVMQRELEIKKILTENDDLFENLVIREDYEGLEDKIIRDCNTLIKK